MENKKEKFLISEEDQNGNKNILVDMWQVLEQSCEENFEEIEIK